MERQEGIFKARHTWLDIHGNKTEIFSNQDNKFVVFTCPIITCFGMFGTNLYNL